MTGLSISFGNSGFMGLLFDGFTSMLEGLTVLTLFKLEVSFYLYFFLLLFYFI